SLLSITDVKPAWILRREVSEETKPPRNRRSIIAAFAILAGLWGIAIWIGDSLKFASVFAGILIGALLVLAGLGALLLRLVRKVSASSFIRRSAAMRHGISNLYRPGTHAAAILASLGIGVM